MTDDDFDVGGKLDGAGELVGEFDEEADNGHKVTFEDALMMGISMVISIRTRVYGGNSKVEHQHVE